MVFPLLSRAVRRHVRFRLCSSSVVFALAAVSTGLPAAAAEYPLEPGQKTVGEATRYTVKEGEVFGDIARQFDIGYTELVTANPGVNPWVPGAGRTITIPTVHVLPDAPREGIVINLAQWRLFYFPPGGDRVETHPITIGFVGKNTPVGATRVVSKEPNPTWYPPASIRSEEPDLPAAVPPGPDNPLGAFALHLGWKNYLIHGTNKPDSIGRAVSHGCMRLYPEDVEKLFGEVGVGTPVHTVQEPATTGWQGDALYVQVYPSKSQTEEIDTMQPVTSDPATGVEAVVRAAAGNYADLIDWNAVRRAAQQRTGMAVKVADRSPGGMVASRDEEPTARYGASPSQYGSSASRYDASASRYDASASRYGSAYPYDAAPSRFEGSSSRNYGPPPGYEGPASYYAPPPGYGQPAAEGQKLYTNWYTGR